VTEDDELIFGEVEMVVEASGEALGEASEDDTGQVAEEEVT